MSKGACKESLGEDAFLSRLKSVLQPSPFPLAGLEFRVYASQFASP